MISFPFIKFLKTPIVEVICVTYRQSGPLQVLIQSFLNQTYHNWILNVIHDGDDQEFQELMKAYSTKEKRIKFSCSSNRFNDWGHSLRREAIRSIAGDYVLITNGDNYYVPIFVEEITKKIIECKSDVIIFDMIHSHNTPGGRDIPSYSYFETAFSRCNVDMGAAVVKSSIAKSVGFRDLTHDGDATYFEDIIKLRGSALKLDKIKKVLFVHN
jgi:hypothetical protein